MLAASANWWNMADNDIVLLLEQEHCEMRLANWVVQDSSTKLHIACANWMVKAIQFADYGESKHLDFTHWNKAGFNRFKDLLSRGQFPEFAYFFSKINGCNRLQYYQVRRLVKNLERKRRTNLSKLEGLLVSRVILRKPLSKIYTLLVEKSGPDNTNSKKREREIGKEIREKT